MWLVRASSTAGSGCLSPTFLHRFALRQVFALPPVFSHAKTGGKAKNRGQGKGFRNRSQSVILPQFKNSTFPASHSQLEAAAEENPQP